MSKYTANPKTLKNHTQATEASVDMDPRISADFLPGIFQTEVNDKFFKTTLDHLLSSGSTETLDTYWGKLGGARYRSNIDLFSPEHNARRVNYQLAPGTSIIEGQSIKDSMSYINMLNNLEHIGADTSDHDRLMTEPGYALNLPIDNDMFVNFTNYFWLATNIPVCSINATATDPIDIDDIVRCIKYTTPVLENGKTLELVSGMRIQFSGDNVTSTSGDYQVGAVYWVEGIGRDIRLVMQRDADGVLQWHHTQTFSSQYPEPWDTYLWDEVDWDDTFYVSELKDYVVSERSSCDANSWARSNQWYSHYAISATCEFIGLDLPSYTENKNRGKRPILCYTNDIELFNSGRKHYANINLVIANVSNPATIIGREYYNNIADVVTEDWQEKAYKFGDRVRRNINGDLRYYECILTHYEEKDPAGDEARIHWEQITGTSLKENDKVVFVNADNTAYQNKIFQVSGVGSSIELTDITGQPEDYDKIVVIASSNPKYAGAELYYLNGELVYGQQKTARGAAPKFQLYDKDELALDKHTESDFIGDSIFAYTANSVGIVDEELGFAPKYNDASSNEDYQFDFSLHSKRYFENISTGGATEIQGLYFYKNLCTGKMHSGWEPVRGEQRVPIVQTHIAIDETPVSFELGTEKVEYTTEYFVMYDTNGYRFSAIHYYGIEDILEDNPMLMLHKGRDYKFTAAIRRENNQLKNLIEFVDEKGNTVNGDIVNVSGDTITLNIPSDYKDDCIVYRSVIDSSIKGVLYLYDENYRRVIIKHNGKLLHQESDYTFDGTKVNVNVSVVKDDVVELSYIADEPVANAVYDVAPVHKYNPLNEDFDKVFYSNLFEHFEDQMINHPGFIGDVTGFNNYYQLPQITFGGTIREQIHSPSKFSWMSGINGLNPINSIISISNDYNIFKDMFKTKVEQIYKTKNDMLIPDIVDMALQEIQIGKNSTFKYANSDMVYYKDFHIDEIGVSDASTVFYLNHSVHNYGDKTSHAYVYTYQYNSLEEKYVWTQLLKGRDYTLSGNTLQLTDALRRDQDNNTAIIKVKFTTAENKSFIPPSAAKLGFVRPFDVEITEGVLLGHDGSTYTLRENANILNLYNQDFDIVGACLYELELRITNGMTEEFDVPLSMDTWMPNANFVTGYTWNDLTAIFDDWYNRWAYRNKAGDIGEFQWRAYDKFTWNYSSVAPHIGGWQGIYHYFFGTDRPHTHPWEMLGHHRKPWWWDEHYSWTDPVKRRFLIEALKNGIDHHPDDDHDETIFVQPESRVAETRLARIAYNWDINILVTVDGNLNDPVTAGVVARPTNIEASKPFVFGDWGPVEAEWRRSSEYQFAVTETLMVVKPYRTFEQTWKLGSIVKLAGSNIHFDQFVHKTFCKREGIKDQLLHNCEYSSGTIVDLDIIEPGSGYTTATVEVQDQCNSNDREVPNVSVTIVNGEISGLSLSGGSNGFTNTFDINIVGDGTGSTGLAQVRQNQLRSVFGLNNGIIEWASSYGISPAEIKTTLNKMATTLVLHVGGYTDKNIIDASIDSSYQKGRTSIPAPDYSIMLQKSAPVKSYYFSGVKIVREELTFKVFGFDQNRRSFVTDTASQGGKSTNELIQSLPRVDVTRQLNFLNQHQTVRYGTEFLKRQELYNFLIELGHYYKTLGFEVFNDWVIDSNRVIKWALDAEPGDEYTMQGHNGTIAFKQPKIGYVDNLNYIYDGSANIQCQCEEQIHPKNLLVLRDEENPDCPGDPDEYFTLFTLKDTFANETDRDILGLRVNIVEYEHIMAFMNITQFNDLVYDPTLGISQARIKLVGERTQNWNGKMEAPGYLVRQSGIITNIESSVREIENDNINSESKTLARDTRATARFNTGYVEPTYLTNTFVEDNAAYNFGKAARQYKGTPMGISAMMRNINIFGVLPEHNIGEDWMIRLGEYGDISKRQPIEVQLDFDLIKSSPQPLRFNTFNVYDNLDDRIIDITPFSKTLVTGNVSDQTFDMLPFNDNDNIETSYLFKDHSKNANLPLLEEADFYIKSIDDIYGTYDDEAGYANILPWTPTVSYDKGDLVRKDGKVYKLEDSYTELTTEGDEIVLAGTTIEPTVATGQTFVIDNVTIPFAKTQTDITYNSISITGSQGNPSFTSPSSMVIDGVTVDFYKTEDIITFEDIQINAQVVYPAFTPTTSSSSFITIDSNTISFDDTTTESANVSAQQAFEEAFEDAFSNNTISQSNAYVLASENRIEAIENLRVAYQQIKTSAEWTNWITEYYGTSNIGLNIEFLRYTKSQNLTNDPFIKTQTEHQDTAGNSVIVDSDNNVNQFRLLREYEDDTSILVQYDGQALAINAGTGVDPTPSDATEQFIVDAPADSTDTIDIVYTLSRTLSPTTWSLSSVSLNATVLELDVDYYLNGQDIVITTTLNANDVISAILTHSPIFTDDTPAPIVDTVSGIVSFATPPRVTFTITYSTPNYVQATWLDEIDQLIVNDIEIINNIQGTSFNAVDIYSNITESNWDQISPSLISNRDQAKTALANAVYLGDVKSFLINNPTLAFVPGRSVFSDNTSVPLTYSITSVVDKINSYSLTGIVASDFNGRLRIDCTNGSLVLGGDPDTLAALGLTLASTQTWQTTQITTTVHVDLEISDIIEAINLAGIPSVVASASGTQLNITKATTETDDTLTIGGQSAVLNAIGISAGATTATTESDTFEVDLNLSEVIAAINNAAIPNVTATSTNRRVVLTSSNPSVNIGNGTANSTLGFIAGVTFAPDENVKSSFEDYNWSEVVDPANYRTWLLDNLGSEIVDTENNREPGYSVYQLMDFNDIIISIEEGFNEAGDSILVSTKYAHNLNENDIIMLLNTNCKPAVDGIHRVTGIASDQSFYINEFIHESGFGNLETTQVGTVANPTVNIGDALNINGTIVTFTGDSISSIINDWEAIGYDLITISETVDNRIQITSSTYDLDITGIGSAATDLGLSELFTISKEVSGQTAGKMLVFRSMRFDSTLDVFATASTPAYAVGLTEGTIAYADVANDTDRPAVYEYKYDLEDELFYWDKIRDEQQKTDNTKLANVVIYDAVESKTVRQYEVYDPAKGIIPGIVDKELDFRRDGDIAVYNSTTDENKETIQTRAWASSYIGKTWWDTGNAVYLDYEQSDIDYRQNNWGRLFETGSIDIYEWTRSTVAPEDYDQAVFDEVVVDGKPLTGTPFKQENRFTGDVDYYWTETVEFDPTTESDETYYYFWVKDKTTLPDRNRYYTTFQLAEILENPEAAGIYWCAACTENVVMISNLTDLIGNDNLVVQINFDRSSTDLHREYILLTEDDARTIIPEWLHFGLRDSLARFDESKAEYQYTDWAYATSYPANTVVRKDGEFYQAIRQSQSVDPELGTDMYYWKKLYDVVADPAGDWPANTVLVPRPQSVPDVSLHKYNRLGIDIRPRQTWIDDVYEARRVLVDKLNRQLRDINIIRTFHDWNAFFKSKLKVGLAEYDMSCYWSWIDWAAPGFMVGTDVDYIVDKRASLDAYSAEDLIVGELALAQESDFTDNVTREEIYMWDGTHWTLVWQERATVEFNSLLWHNEVANLGWDTGNWDDEVWDNDPGAVVAEILDVIRNDYYVGQYQSYYADLWFTMLNYIHSEQKGLDWAFKSTYIKVAVNLIIDDKSRRFVASKEEELEHYINTVKPFHTKLRDFVVSRTLQESVFATVEEFTDDKGVWMQPGTLEGPGFTGLVLDAGSFTEKQEDLDAGSFVTESDTFEFVYNGHEFNLLDYYDIGSEVFPAKFNETVDMRIQTNLDRYLETDSTRSFRVLIKGHDNTIETTAITDDRTTTLTETISSTSDVVKVADASVLFDPADTTVGHVHGKVFIGNERISYTGIVGNTLVGVQRGVDGTAADTHIIGKKVIDSSQRTWVKPPAPTSEYSKYPEPLFNDFGRSMVGDDIIRYEAALLNRFGKGTI